VNASGKRSLVFSENQGIDGTRMDIPCGWCVGCRLDKAGDWQARLVHESKMHVLNSFITLTYSPENLPKDGSLHKADFQKFMKRLRKNTGVKIRYFVCGEYGEQTQRPHYHAIIFGYDWPDRRHCGSGSKGDKLYKSAKLDAQWGLGQCFIGTVTPESCGYVARYVMKKITGQQAEEHYKRVDEKTGEIFDILPEYINMSTNPGIGFRFYEEFKDEIRRSDSILLRGSARRVPRGYDRRLGSEDPEALEEVKFLRSENARKYLGETTEDRLSVREEVKLSKIRNLKRTHL